MYYPIRVLRDRSQGSLLAWWQRGWTLLIDAAKHDMLARPSIGGLGGHQCTTSAATTSTLTRDADVSL